MTARKISIWLLCAVTVTAWILTRLVSESFLALAGLTLLALTLIVITDKGV